MENIVPSWTRLHNEEPYNFHLSPDDIGLIKARRTKWAGPVSCMEEMRSA
jgi:hypothetical protein